MAGLESTFIGAPRWTPQGLGPPRSGSRVVAAVVDPRRPWTWALRRGQGEAVTPSFSEPRMWGRGRDLLGGGSVTMRNPRLTPAVLLESDATGTLPAAGPGD